MMLKFRTVKLSSAICSPFPDSSYWKQCGILQAAINEIGEQNIRYITSSAGAGGANPLVIIFYHEDDPA